jgi:AraC family transcriptional activator of pyochelin receptor
MLTTNSIDCSSERISTQSQVIHKNIRLIIQKASEGQKLYYVSNQNEEMVELGFNLGGTIRCVLKGHPYTRILQSDYGQAHIGFYPGCSGILEYFENQPVCWLGILLPVDVFRTFFDGPLVSLVPKNTLYSKDGVVHKLVGPITAGMKVALHQILMCPFLGKTRCLFLESKVLELISHVRFCADRAIGSPSYSAVVNLTADDHEKMWQAKSILDENLENPPSIRKLAKRVGVNEFKLKNGFRQVHGITPYRYLAEQRLEMARRLLRERQTNVTEAAFAAGYSSLSHFAKIFRAKFGVNPREYLAESENCFEPPFAGQKSTIHKDGKSASLNQSIPSGVVFAPSTVSS